MPPSRSRLTLALLRHPLAWLALASLLITLFLGAPQIEALRAFQTSEPPTATNSPPPTATLAPTTAVPTNTPPLTDTPSAAATAPPPTATFPIPDTATPVAEIATPIAETATPLSTETPLAAPAATLPPIDTPSPPVIPASVTPPPLPTPAEAQSATHVITQTEAAAPPAQNADALVELIDAFVLYSAYFLLGCGIIVFIALAVGFYYLQRRGRGPD